MRKKIISSFIIIALILVIMILTILSVIHVISFQDVGGFICSMLFSICFILYLDFFRDKNFFKGDIFKVVSSIMILIFLVLLILTLLFLQILVLI